MILRSDNVGIKRPMYSYFLDRGEIKHEEEEDIISRLPDEILTHILSLLPDSRAYRTRILSKRWNRLCFFLPSLRFVHSFHPSFSLNGVCTSPLSVEEFHDFVQKSLASRGDMPIQRFSVSFSRHYDHNRVLDWLRIVLDSKLLHTLELGFPSKKDRFSLSLDLLMTRNNTLVDLTLKNVDMVAIDETQLLFPCLKKVNLVSIVYPGRSLQNLIYACPVLHELCLDGQNLHYDLHTFKIFLPSLKRLLIKGCDFGKVGKVVIDAPKLEYFHITDYSSSAYSLTNSSSLVEAHIDIYTNSDIQLLTNISSARILTLGRYFLSVLRDNPRLNIHVFPNFVKLIVEFSNIPTWDILFILLNRMPNLQHITIHFGYHFKRICNPPRKAPACLRLMLKEVVILNQYAPDAEDYITLITYLLNNSRFLEKLTLSTYNINHERREKLSKIHRCSKSCQIEFVEAY